MRGRGILDAFKKPKTMEQVEAEMGSAAEARLGKGAMGDNPLTYMARVDKTKPKGPGNQRLIVRDEGKSLLSTAAKFEASNPILQMNREKAAIDKGLVMGTNPMASKGASRRRRLTRRRR
jgi:hypothetical protein